MPRYINKALTKYQHPKPVSPQHAPYKAAPIQYGALVQRVEVDTTQPLTPKEIKCVQDIIGTLLYYARAVDPTLLATLSAIAARQCNGTRAVADACNQLLDYVTTHPNAGNRYKACDMVLSVHTDASYLSGPGGKSRVARHFYLSNRNDEDFNNSAILNLSTIIKHVMLSASKADFAPPPGKEERPPLGILNVKYGGRRIPMKGKNWAGVEGMLTRRTPPQK
jgi:hypothetical protein